MVSSQLVSSHFPQRGCAAHRMGDGEALPARAPEMAPAAVAASKATTTAALVDAAAAAAPVCSQLVDAAAAAGPAAGMAARVGRAKAASLGPGAMSRSLSLQIEGLRHLGLRQLHVGLRHLGLRQLQVEGPALWAPELALEIFHLQIEEPALRAPSSQASSA